LNAVPSLELSEEVVVELVEESVRVDASRRRRLSLHSWNVSVALAHEASVLEVEAAVVQKACLCRPAKKVSSSA
jgi:hypothetical protein